MYLVTGGAGFIGSNIVRRLLVDGEKVRVLDDYSTGRKANLAGLENVEIVEGSLLDTGCLRRSLKDVSFVLHQGAIPSVPRSVADPIKSNEVNVDGTLNLLVAAREAGVKRLIYAASSSAYGDAERLPKEESMPPDPLSPYAVCKYTGELYARVFAKIYGLETVSLRYFNVFGPYQDPASEYAAVIPKFIKLMLKDERPVIYGDGTQSRDFTYIENAVEANILALHAPRAGQGEVVNVACGERYSLNSLVELLNKILSKNLKPIYAEARSGDVRHSMADISQAGELLGYSPVIGFEEGLRLTVEWYRKS